MHVDPEIEFPFGSIFTRLIQEDCPQSLGELASYFGLTRPHTMAHRSLVDDLRKVLQRMREQEWILQIESNWNDPLYIARNDRFFEFYEKHPSSRALVEMTEESARGRHFSRKEIPREKDKLAAILMAKFVLGERSRPGELLKTWSKQKNKIFSPGVATELARRLGVHIPRGIWHRLFPEELKSQFLADIAQDFALSLRRLPDFWRSELEQCAGARAKAQLAYIQAIDQDLDFSKGPARRNKSKFKELDNFRRLYWSGRYCEAYGVGCRVIEANEALEEPQLRALEGLDMMLCAIAVSGERPEGLLQAASWSQKRYLSTPVPSEFYDIVRGIVDCINREACLEPEEWIRALEKADPPIETSSPRAALMIGLGLVWTRANLGLCSKTRKGFIDYLKSTVETSSPCVAAARELEGVIKVLQGEVPETPCLAKIFQTRSSWERVLDRLHNAAKPCTIAEEQPEPSFVKHISWEIQARRSESSSWFRIQPRIIGTARSKRGSPVSLRTLREKYEELFNERDVRVLSHLKFDNDSSYYSHGRSLALKREALLELVGHPHVQDENGQALKVQRGVIEVRVERSRGTLLLTVQPNLLCSGPAVCWEHPAKGRLLVYHRTPALSAIFEVFGEGKLSIPMQGGERLSGILQSISKYCRIIIDGELMESQAQHESDSELYIALRWTGSVLQVDAQVLPFGDTEMHCFPGRGDVHVTQMRGDRLCSSTRDLELEHNNLDKLLEACPTLRARSQKAFERGEPCEVGQIEDSLSVVLELAQAGARVSWRSEQILRTPNTVDDSPFRIRVGKAKEWFETAVVYAQDAEHVIGFKQLVEARIGDSRFIQIGKDKIIALSHSMKRRFDELSNLGPIMEYGVRTPLSALPMIDSLLGHFKNQELDSQSAEQIEILRVALASNPSAPASLKAKLRPYQLEGYQWMYRLAEAQLGACLSDDMGLGKTVQTLALLCERQAQGPALVVAPACVVSNWIDETKRFAPKLKVMDLAELRHASDLQSWTAGSVVVSSYGIMVKEIDHLGGQSFATLVFDEAHTLKNWRTRRTQAARRLRSDFRLGLTGTPIENHVGEVWSLFQILVPGLLGSKQEFERKFSAMAGVPNIPAIRARLQPFLLRRTKAQVLTELPELNESVLKVVPNPTEAAFYQGLQLKAKQACARAEASPDPRDRLQVFAELSRLRRAAVDPRLVDKLVGPPGEKIRLLTRKLLALKEEGHRALVFSQFLGSLSLLKEALEREQVEYFELTGSTPANARAKRIAKFQAGERAVFLISLKAGGVGVNLTAADYVFHLDPWWNPAVEEQATARAHRMGQSKPVQVYRLICAGTIEEKIARLHARKREIFDDLLGNLDRAKKLSFPELRKIILDEEPAPGVPTGRLDRQAQALGPAAAGAGSK